MIHCSNGGYNFGGYGDTALAVAINPMDVVFAPYSDHSKMRVLAITPLCTLKNDCDFELTPDIEEIIDQMMADHLKRLEDIDNSFFKLGKEHTLLKEVPDINISFFSVIKQTVDPSLAKERYTKL